jgi:hypothetical protein
MTVKELRAILFTLPQNLEVKCEIEDLTEEDNYWLENVECSPTGSSGYEIEGEVRLIFNQ